MIFIQKSLKQNLSRWVFAAMGISLLVAIVIPVYRAIAPDIVNIIKNGDYASLEAYIKSFGAVGILVAIALQMLQVFTVVIPSPAIWISVGAVYGILPGMVICCVGMILGNGVVFVTVRKLGLSESDQVNPKKPAMLERIKNPDLVLFFMYALPGVPNGLVPYIYARSSMTTVKFLSIIGTASIPSVLCSTCVGKLLLDGRYLQASLVFGVMAVGVVLLLIYNQKIIGFIEQLESKRLPK